MAKTCWLLGHRWRDPRGIPPRYRIYDRVVDVRQCERCGAMKYAERKG